MQTAPRKPTNISNAMKNRSITALVATAALFPGLSQAHPGHSAFDFSSGLPHAGHEIEVAMVLAGATLTVLLAALARWRSGRKQ